jgi:hypothetical protein
VICQSCGHRIADNAIVCYRCGAPTAVPAPAGKPPAPPTGQRMWLVVAVIVIVVVAALVILGHVEHLL